MRYLIVNGDDFGASRGINRGIIEAHRSGILTSTSLIVTTVWSEEAAFLSRQVPTLSIGLHVDLDHGQELTTSPMDGEGIRAELQRQFFRFQELVGRLPSHLDSHHNVHRDPRLLPHFLDLAREYSLPLREQSPVRYFSKFYGRWGGETHPEQISVESLVRMLETEVREGITELSCHPGYIDSDFASGYSTEREIELRTLCDSRAGQALTQKSIQLVSYHDLGELLASLPI